MLLAFLSIALSAQAPDLSREVTFTGVAKPAKRMLADLSGPAGVTLTTSQLMENEVLVLHLDKAPLGEVMKRIASVTGGSWQQEEGQYRLIRTASQEQEQEKAELEQRAAWVKKSIADLTKDLREGPMTSAKAVQSVRDLARIYASERQTEHGTDIYIQRQRLELNSAAGTLLRKLLLMLDPQEVARIPFGARVVFSTSPTRMQRPFRGDARTALAAYSVDHEVWREAGNKVRKEMVEVDDELQSNVMAYAAQQSPPKKALLSITQNAIADSLEMELKVGDMGDRLLADEFHNIGLSLEPRFASVSGEKPLEFSELAKQHHQAVRAPTKPVEASLLELMSRPDEHDPLGFSISESLIGIAKARSKNLVACVPDQLALFEFYLDPNNPKLTPSLALQGIDYSNSVIKSEEGAWLTFQPRQPVRSRLVRSNRSALGAFLRDVLKNKRQTLENATKLALSTRVRSPLGPLFRLYRPVLTAYQGDAFPDANVLRLYSTLNAQQRKALREGGQFPYSQMNQTQRRYLEDMVFGPRVDFTATTEARQLDPKNPRHSFAFRGMLWEVTEFLPNGLPPDGYFTMTGEEQAVLLAYSLGEGGYTGQVVSIQHMVNEMATRQVSPGASGPSIDEFRQGKRLQLQFTFHLADPFSLERKLNETTSDPAQKRMRYSDLPESMRKEIEAKGAALKKALEQNLPGPKKPPPPR